MLTAAVAVAVMLFAAVGADAQEVKLRASGSFPAGHTGSIAMEVFKSELARRTNGAITVELFPGNTLGGAFEQVDQVRTGQVHMAWAGPSFYDRLVPEFNAATLPFAANTASQAFCMIDSELGTYLAERSAEKGVLVLGWGSNGFRHITNNKRPIKKIDDLKGLKIRTPSGEVFSLTFRAVGANPTPIDIKELYQALQQGVVDGQENPFSVINASRYFEVQKFVSNTAHFFDFINVVANRRAFEALPPAQQKVLRASMAKAVAWQRSRAAAEEAESIAEIKKRGMTYDEVSPQFREQMRKASAGVVEDVKKRVGADFVNRVQAEIARNRS
jgi:tripartite ATP-independent transporter DctP family solute receptor